MSANQGKKTVGASLLTQQSQFQRELKQGLESGCRANGLELISSIAEYDAAQQCAQVDALIAKKVDAIVITPCSSSAVGLSIEQANRAHIPVFTADIANAGPGGEVTSHVTSDNVLGGRKAAELI